MYNNNNQQQSASLESGIPSVGSIVWAAGRSRAQQAINLYANLDYLRPYFDVEPREVFQRLIRSLIPARVSRDDHIKPELYGPSMIAFTLAAILIYQMKVSSHSVQDGTLIGASFLVCFGYWIGSSFAVSSLSFICNTQLSLMQILSINGYALFSHCVVLFLATFIHTGYDHLLFYGLWGFVGGAAAIRMAVIIMSRTVNPRYRALLGLLIVSIHMFFLLYLHFAYHAMAETVAHALNNERNDVDVDVAEALKPVSTLIPEVVKPALLKRQIQDNVMNISKTTIISSSTSTRVAKA
ncbi:unnamed protein product [Rotaria socialis]|uniref:Protein YIPF3 n=1 Tax=Rotaria socialis TaxID=392032 RepID=A0A817TTX1_9BILA|nr:unnamed protein product [Rotaria socialis]CAF3316694.1 unnamed protein product [Rotaria socialis]CAF3453424.1 unnamed protein product [Rotaria socialis]CAF3473740.1 unnamed protein product [Rotaria socialis]CAF3521982.1 unnamed protein product [Rotaria socialis]